MTEQTQYRPAVNPAAVQGYRKIEEFIPGHWTEETLIANDIKQHYYRTGGNKPPLVLLHGILTGGLYWLRVAKALEADYDVIIPDARGHGRSERISKGFSYVLLTEDAAAFIRELKLDKPAVLGHSMGGVTAALVAASYPELVDTLIIEDAVWGDTDPSKRAQLANSEGYQAWINFYTSYLERLKTQSHEERLVSALSQLPPGSTLMPEEEYVPWVESQAQLDLDLVIQGQSLWSEQVTPLRELVPRISCPILLMTAARGNCDPQEVEKVVAALQNGQHVLFEDAGHLINLDQFDKFIEVVKVFLKEH